MVKGLIFFNSELARARACIDVAPVLGVLYVKRISAFFPLERNLSSEISIQDAPFMSLKR